MQLDEVDCGHLEAGRGLTTRHLKEEQMLSDSICPRWQNLIGFTELAPQQVFDQVDKNRPHQRPRARIPTFGRLPNTRASLDLQPCLVR